MRIRNVRKTGKRTYRGEIPVSDLMKADLQMRCAWKDCTNTHKFGNPPADWVNLLVWSGKPDASHTQENCWSSYWNRCNLEVSPK